MVFVAIISNAFATRHIFPTIAVAVRILPEKFWSKSFLTIFLIEDLPISTGVFTAGTISFDRWNYYHISILGDDALEITVAETREDHQLGLLWVFAKKNGRPTIDDNDYRNQSDTSLLTIWIPSTSARGNWTIGVTGSPRNHGIFVERATYTLIGKLLV